MSQITQCLGSFVPLAMLFDICLEKIYKLDPVGSTVRYEMMKLCTGSEDSMRR